MKITSDKTRALCILLIAGITFTAIPAYAEKPSGTLTKKQTDVQPDSDSGSQTSFQADTPADQASTLSDSFAELQSSISGAVEQEKASLEAAAKSVSDEKASSEKLEKEAGVYKILISSAQNLILIPDADIDMLKKNSEELGLMQSSLEGILENIKSGKAENSKVIEETKEKIQVSQKQIDSIKKEYGKEKDVRQIIKTIEDLNRSRHERLKSLRQLDDIHEKQIRQLSSVIEPNSDLSSRVVEKLRIRQQEVLFERNHNIIDQLKPSVIMADLKSILGSVTNFFSKSFWQSKMSNAGAGDIFTVILHIFALAASFFILEKIRKHLKLAARIPEESKFGNIRNIMFFTDKAFVLALITSFLFIYEKFREYTGLYAFINPVQKISAAFLILYLFGTALDIYLKKTGTELSEYVISKKAIFINSFYVFSFFYILIEWISGAGSTTLLIARLFLEITAVFCFIKIWKKFNKKTEDEKPSEKESEKKQEAPFSMGKWLGYTITGVGLTMETAGYGYLTIHWYKGWIITATITSVIYFSLMALKEWDEHVKEKETRADISEGGHQEKQNVYPLYWLGIRIAAVSMLLVGSGSVAYICGAREKVFDAAWGLFTHRIEIGGIKFSISSMLMAVFVILLTQAFTRIWRSIMLGKILKNSGIEPGLQDSITTISAYLIWGIGILTAMHAFGLSTTSLAVGFGALGIGLGFGLQNIFNNFISGLILLFERPIQVGDVVEVGGVLGMVTKINVRSTLVQTYSNASFIIPNSEFISNKVINWSHKDPYIKRDVTIGVAYGTDPQRVRELLLEAAEGVPEIINFPMAPNVSFINFGDSSLDFKIKFWTTIDDFSAAESKLRFEIEKKFRENNISIPFPQREIRIIEQVQ